MWLRARNLEPRLSPFDPAAVLDEIQRLVPGYDFPRLNLLAGNDVHLASAEAGTGGADGGADMIRPAADTLFTSGTLGRYSRTLNSVMERRVVEAAD